MPDNRAVRIRDATSADAAAIAAIGTVGFTRTHERLLGTPAARAIVEQSYTRLVTDTPWPVRDQSLANRAAHTARKPCESA